MKQVTTWIFLIIITTTYGCPDIYAPPCPDRPEQCNGIDDDCDGRTDEGDNGGPLRRACETPCGTGQEECEDGQWQHCDAPPRIDEVCNGHDDDCDGIIDDGCGCVHGYSRTCGHEAAGGACSPGVQHCDSGFWGECRMPHGTTEPLEICGDGISNDCDDEIDESCSCDLELDQASSCGSSEGECKPGVRNCLDDGNGGTIWGTCEGKEDPKPETCDGLDNDCDGVADATVAPNGEILYGWLDDAFEPNNECRDAAKLGDIYKGSDRVVHDPTKSKWDDQGYPTLTLRTDRLGRDRDWYSIKPLQSGSNCLPWQKKHFDITVELTLIHETSPAALPQDFRGYRLCVGFADDCGGTVDSAAMDCSHNSDYVSGSFKLFASWEGSCKNHPTLFILVESPENNACGRYNLKITNI